MNRIDSLFQRLRSKGEKALALFVTAGFPGIDSTPHLVWDLEDAGADIIELGMPFSDPVADGPSIQRSSSIALSNGVSLETALADVRRIRSRSNIPIILMGYLNPIMRYGTEHFFGEAHASGVDGIILPEVPKEESARFLGVCQANELARIFLVAPTTSSERIAEIDAISTGFLYCVSTTGVTGTQVHAPAIDYVKRVKSHATRNPVLVGFGISTADDARVVAAVSDGVIVGSALIRRLIAGTTEIALKNWVREMKGALQ
jgi:tryptophan synthase alpha chain